MPEIWKKKLACVTQCPRCNAKLSSADQRILSVFDHLPICMPCKQKEEKRPDYEQVSKEAIGQCMIDVELAQEDPGGFCFHHFYPFTC
jgi:hypothetical protein